MEGSWAAISSPKWILITMHRRGSTDTNFSCNLPSRLGSDWKDTEPQPPKFWTNQTCGTVSLCHEKISKTTFLMANSPGQKFFHICFRRNRICIHASLKFMSLQPRPVAKSGWFWGGGRTGNIQAKHWWKNSALGPKVPFNECIIHWRHFQIHHCHIVSTTCQWNWGPSTQKRRHGSSPKRRVNHLLSCKDSWFRWWGPRFLLGSSSRSSVEIKKCQENVAAFFKPNFSDEPVYIYPK